ncbi:MAG: sugar kinase [Candidatus Latescibacterota bacterium]
MTVRRADDGPVLVLGEVLVEFMPGRIGESLAGAFHFEKYAGGAPATYAAQIAACGRRAGVISKVGQDPFSTYLLEALVAAGVETHLIRRLPDRQIGLCFHQCLGGVTSLVFYRRDSAASTLCPEDVDPPTIRAAAALHVPGTTLQISASAMAACLKAIRLAREAGVVVSFDPNVRSILGGLETSRATEEALASADVVTPTLEEATAITGQTDPFRAARELRARGPRLVAVTLAAQGAVLLADGEPLLCPGYEVEVVEPTGAGDCHAAATMVGFLSGWDLERIGLFANAAGAHAVTAMGHLGAALPSLAQIQALQARGHGL